jgi:Domain of unknown function (DUF1937)
MSEPFGKMVYLASPYSHPDKSVEVERFVAACKACGWLMNNVKDVTMFYSPIAHTHPISLHCVLPGHWQFWATADETVLSRCNAIWVLCIPGWTKSTGVNAEKRIAAKFGLEVRYVIPSIPMATTDGYTITEIEPSEAELYGSVLEKPVCPAS